MRGALLCAAVSLLSCAKNESREQVVLPRVSPDTVVVSWSVISRTADRDSLHVVLEGSQKLTVTNRSPNGTMMSLSRTVSDEEYTKLVGTLRKLSCCSLRSTTKERASPGEAKPALEIDFGDTKCAVELWDSEWRAGLARECGFAVARVHGGGFVPDPPVDDPPP